MSGRNLFATILMTCLLTIGFVGIAPVANAASAGQSFPNPGKSAKNNVIEIKDRGHGHGPRLYLRIGPTYGAYDYPYYYSRGYYPRHIGPGYIYYGHPYSYYYGSDDYAKSGDGWEDGDEEYNGCLGDDCE